MRDNGTLWRGNSLSYKGYWDTLAWHHFGVVDTLTYDHFLCFSEYMQFTSIDDIYKTSMISSSGCHRNCISWTYANEVQDMEKEGKNVILINVHMCLKVKG